VTNLPIGPYTSLTFLIKTIFPFSFQLTVFVLLHSKFDKFVVKIFMPLNLL